MNRINWLAVAIWGIFIMLDLLIWYLIVSSGLFMPAIATILVIMLTIIGTMYIKEKQK